MIQKILYTVVFVFSTTYYLSAQDVLLKANAAYNSGDFETAIYNFNLYKDISQDADILERRGVSYYKINNLPKAIYDLTLARKLGNENPDLYLKMAKIKQYLGEYEEAIFFYQQYKNLIAPESAGFQLANREIKNCIYNAQDILHSDVALVQSFGEEVNTQYDELHPLQSPLFGNVYYFTSNRNRRDFQIKSHALKMNGKWEEILDHDKIINSSDHDFSLDVSQSGSTMLLSKKDGETKLGRLLFSNYDSTGREIKIKIPASVLSAEGDVQIVNRNTLVFSSNALEGFGGYDIYTVSYKDGKWTTPKNLGPHINSTYDERFPYLTSDENHLFFSSNKPYSFGGFDIYYCGGVTNQTPSKNVGTPINSSGDDISFRIDEEGHKALFSSDRKSGEGGFDLYFGYMMKFYDLPLRDSVDFLFIKDALDSFVKSKEENLATIKKQVNQRKKKDDKQLAEKTEKAEKIKTDAEKLKESLTTKKETELVAEESNKKETKVEESTSNATKSDTTTDLLTTSDEDVKPVKAETKLEEPATHDTKVEPAADLLITSNENLEPIVEKKEIKTPRKKLPKLKSHTVYYVDRHDILNDQNKLVIESLAKQLLDKPDTKIRLTVHTDLGEPGLPEFVQYNTLQRGKIMSEGLMEYGIEPERIILESVANNFPVSKMEVAGETNSEFIPFNKRIDAQIISSKGAILKDYSLDPSEIPLHSRDRKYILFSDIREELYYSVQIAETKLIFKNAILRMYQDIYVRRETADSPNQYFIGMYTSYKDALELKKNLEATNLPMHKIVAYYNGNKVSKEDIKALSAIYPDIQEYKDELD